MHIIHAIDSAGVYGAEVVLLSLAAEQQRLGDHPVILSLSTFGGAPRPLEAEAKRRGLPCITVHVRHGFSLSGAAALGRAIAELPGDIVHSHGYKTNILLGLPWVTVSAPVITTLHGWTATRSLSRLGLYRYIDQRMLGRLDGVVAVSRSMLELPLFRRLDRHRVTYIRNGLATRRSPPTSEMDGTHQRFAEWRRNGETIIGAVGRLSAEKNIQGLIVAFAGLGNVSSLRLVILGAGPDMLMLRQQVSNLGLEQRVCFMGYIPGAEKYISELDVLVMPSLTEGLPMTLLEAMREGVPVVASAVGEIPNVLASYGQLTTPGDIDNLRERLSAVLADPLAARRMSEAGRERIEREFSAEGMAKAYRSFYSRVQENKDRGR